MAYRSYLRSVINDNFKILTWVLILFIAITPNFIFINSSNANTATSGLNGWEIVNRAMEGATRVYNGAKTTVINGANVAKTGVAKIAPSADMLAKAIKRTGAVVAVDLAIQSLIGGVDYVMNNADMTVEYTVPSGEAYVLYNGLAYYDFEQACKDRGNYDVKDFDYSRYELTSTLVRCYAIDLRYGSSTYQQEVYDFAFTLKFSTSTQQRSIPYSAVGQQLIDEAETGEARAGAYVGEAIDYDTLGNAIGQANIARQMENTAETEVDNTVTPKPDTSNPNAPPEFELPAFCGWAPVVCEAASAVISLPNTLEQWWETATTAISDAWTYAKDWFTEEYEDTEDTEVQIEENENIIFDDSQRLNFSNSCPSPEQFSVSFFGASQNLEFSYQPLCDFMTMIKPFVIAGSYLIGAYIVMGLSRGSGD